MWNQKVEPTPHSSLVQSPWPAPNFQKCFWCWSIGNFQWASRVVRETPHAHNMCGRPTMTATKRAPETPTLQGVSMTSNGDVQSSIKWQHLENVKICDPKDFSFWAKWVQICAWILKMKNNINFLANCTEKSENLIVKNWCINAHAKILKHWCTNLRSMCKSVQIFTHKMSHHIWNPWKNRQQLCAVWNVTNDNTICPMHATVSIWTMPKCHTLCIWGLMTWNQLAWGIAIVEIESMEFFLNLSIRTKQQHHH